MTNIAMTNVALYAVRTDQLEPEPSKKILQVEYRVLACSVHEAAQIIQEGIVDDNEVIKEVFFASHITCLPNARWSIIKRSPVASHP